MTDRPSTTESYRKYTRGYYLPPEPCFDWVKKDYIDQAPAWCSVDLRDGNQALIVPMSLDEKLEFFQMLVKIGFKEIEIGFPAASETEFELARTLIERDMIPDDVTIQVLTQARPHIIRRTFEALEGCKTPVIVHVYNSTSVAQREQVFKKDKDAIKQIAVEGAKLLKELTDENGGHPNYRFEYSPESFTGTEPEYALEVVNAVLDVWQPTPERKAVINLPATVEMSLPHVFASQVEYLSKNMRYRDAVVLSLHPHNDRGTGVADAELGVLAGADRIEGTLFGNGERTGNVDIITLAMNLFSHGVNPNLDFSHMDELVELYERVTRMSVSPRQPYAGQLVFAAFSGSHQDAIAKGFKWREEHDPEHWNLPYLPIDPADVGRRYETDVIRINSQSGKGGVGYVLEQAFGYVLPKPMREEFGYVVKSVSDHAHKELAPAEINDIFQAEYVNRAGAVNLVDFHFVRAGGDTVKVFMTLEQGGAARAAIGAATGRLDAVAEALRKLGVDYHLSAYHEHALDQQGAASTAAAYVCLEAEDGASSWGCGVHPDIITASIRGYISAVNRLMAQEAAQA